MSAQGSNSETDPRLVLVRKGPKADLPERAGFGPLRADFVAKVS